MAWGIFKKIKDGVNKAKKWLSNNLPKINRVFKKAKPIVKNVLDEASNYSKNEKLKYGFGKAKDILDITDDGLDALDDALNKNEYGKVKDWTKMNIIHD